MSAKKPNVEVFDKDRIRLVFEAGAEFDTLVQQLRFANDNLPEVDADLLTRCLLCRMEQLASVVMSVTSHDDLRTTQEMERIVYGNPQRKPEAA